MIFLEKSKVSGSGSTPLPPPCQPSDACKEHYGLDTKSKAGADGSSRKSLKRKLSSDAEKGMEKKSRPDKVDATTRMVEPEREKSFNFSATPQKVRLQTN